MIDVTRDLRDRPRPIGRPVEAFGRALELLGIWIQRQSWELAYRRWHALRRWGQ